MAASTPGFVARPARLSETAVALAREAASLRRLRDAVTARRPSEHAFGDLPGSPAVLAAAAEARTSATDTLGAAGGATDRLADGVKACAVNYQRVDQQTADSYRSLLPSDQNGPPLLPTGEQRRAAIIADLPGRIVVQANPNAKAYPDPWYSLHFREEVTRNDALIEAAARRHGVDPNMARAIVWMESTHGYYDAIVPGNKSIRPMNVHADFWSGMVARNDLNDPAVNIETGVRILAGISDRVVDPTPEKIFTLYNNLRADAVSGYGVTAAHYYAQRPWLPTPPR